MSQFLAAAAASITAVGVGCVGFARSWPGPSGRHRAPARQRIEVPLVGLRSWPEPVFGAAVPQGFRHCPGCGGETSVALHPGAHTCPAGHVTITSTTGGQP